jgi:hypothetical protein
MFSIVLSSCGKKDKSNDFVRTAPVESEIPDESFEYLEYPESPALIETSTPITCDGLAPCRFVRDHWQYEMINVFDVAITPKRVFWTVTAVGSAYAVYKMPVLRWKRTLFGQRNTNGEYGALARRDQDDDGNNSISDWIRDLKCWSVFKHKRSPYAPAPALVPAPAPAEFHGLARLHSASFDADDYWRSYREYRGSDSSGITDFRRVVFPASAPVFKPLASVPLSSLAHVEPSPLLFSVRGGGGGGGLGLGLEAAAEAAEPQGIELGQYVGGEEGNRLIDGQWVHVTRNGGVDIIYNDFGHEDV